MAMSPKTQHLRWFAEECIPKDVKTQNTWFEFIGIKRPKRKEYVKLILDLIKEKELEKEIDKELDDLNK